MFSAECVSSSSAKVETIDQAGGSDPGVAPLNSLQCRTCRKPLGVEACPVEAVLDYHGKSIAEMIFELTEIMVDYDANLPRQICQSCVEDLQSSYNFRQRCIDSNELFLNELNSVVGQTSIMGDSGALILKMEQSDPELTETSQNETLEDQASFETELMHESKGTSPGRRRRIKDRSFTFNSLARNYIVKYDERYYCSLEPQSTCSYSQEILEMGNFVRHFRVVHRQEADRIGLVRRTTEDKVREAPKKYNKTMRKKRYSQYSRIAVQYIKEKGNRIACTIDPSSKCTYSQKQPLVLGNFIRHFRLVHKNVAEREGLMPGVLPTGCVLESRSEKPKEFPERFLSIAERYIQKSDDNRIYCAINELSPCKFSRLRKNVMDFLQHFCVSHPKEAQSKIFSYQSPEKEEIPPLPPKPKEDKEEKDKPKPSPKAMPLPPPNLPEDPASPFIKHKNFMVNIVDNLVKQENGRFQCAIDAMSGCRYAQMKFDKGNFIRHFRVKHVDEAIFHGFIRNEKHMKPEEKKRSIKRQLVSTDIPQLIEACITLMTLHNLPIQCFGWTGMLSLLEPLTTALELEINDMCMPEYIHMAAESLMRIIRKEMKQKMVAIQLESIFHKETHFLTVSANFGYASKVISRVLGIIRATESTTASELKCKLSLLLDQYQLSEHQIAAIVFGNAGSALGTRKRQQKFFTEMLTKPCTDYGAPDKEKILMETLPSVFRGKFEVVRNVISTVLSALNEIVPDDDPTIQRIERFLQDLRSPNVEHLFTTEDVIYPPLWDTHRWVSKFKSIRAIMKQEPFYINLAQQYPELVISESDWQFLREYHDSFSPLYELINDIRKNQEHIVFSSFYVRILAVVKGIRELGNRFSTQISRSLGHRLMELREQMAFQAALVLDPRFHYLQSVLLTPLQKNDAQNYILNIWNRINALKPNSQGSLLDADKLKQEDKKDDDMDDFLSEMFGGPSEGTSKAVVPLTSTVTPVLQQLKSLEIEPRQPHDYDVWNHWLQRSISHSELFSVAMVVMSLPSNNVCMERTYSALILADRDDGLTEQTLDELLLIKLNSSLFEKAVVTMYDWKTITRSQGTE